MRCEECNEDPDVLNIIPTTKAERESGKSLIKIVCTKCAAKSGRWCSSHKRPHLGFEDGSSACTRCIEEKVSSANPEERLEAYRRMWRVLESDEFLKIETEAERAAEIMGCRAETAAYRFVVTKAERMHKTPAEVLDLMFDLQSAEVILS